MKRLPISFHLHTDSEPRPHHADYSNIFRIILKGSLWLVAVVLALLVASYSMGNTYVLGRIVGCAAALGYLVGTRWLARAGHQYKASALLVLFYAALAMANLYVWGVNTPFGFLLIAITIVLASILLEPRRTILVGNGLILFLLGMQYLISYQGYVPQFSDSIKASHFGDAIAYSCGIAVLVLISWLYGRQTQRLLHEARSAEAALARQKDLLEVRVKERTAELERTQLEESRALYQFVEVGQLSAALIHDLANHLTILTMDIEDIKRSQHSRVIARAQKSLMNLDRMVGTLRDQLRGTERPKPFSPVRVVTAALRGTLQKASPNITLTTSESAQKARIVGDPLRFTQVITILVNNAIEAGAAADAPAQIRIRIQANAKDVSITIEDDGPGLTGNYRRTLFKPVQSAKKDGLGIGLFIAHKIIETHFKGRLECTRPAQPTTFTITIPL